MYCVKLFLAELVVGGSVFGQGGREAAEDLEVTEDLGVAGALNPQRLEPIDSKKHTHLRIQVAKFGGIRSSIVSKYGFDSRRVQVGNPLADISLITISGIKLAVFASHNFTAEGLKLTD